MLKSTRRGSGGSFSFVLERLKGCVQGGMLVLKVFDSTLSGGKQPRR